MDEQFIQLILKELDLIDNTISRLDRQIQTSKSICITLWTGWLGWFISQQINHENQENFGLVILASALFPILFWLVDFEYRKSLFSVSKRQILISLHLNVRTNKDSNTIKKIPLLDPVGWLYDSDFEDLIDKCEFELSKSQKKSLTSQNVRWLDILFYKEAKWIYLPLTLISLILGYCFWRTW